MLKPIILLSVFLTISINYSTGAVFENVTLVLRTSSRYDSIEEEFEIDSIPIVQRAPHEEIIKVESSDVIDPYVKDLGDIDNNTDVILEFHGTIPDIPEDFMQSSSSVTKLSFAWSGVKNIAPGSLKNFPKLRIVNYEMNLIEEIKDDVFTGLPLKEIHLNTNKIKIIGKNAFANMKNLEILELFRNQISTWDRDWLLGSTMQRLSLSINKITSIPPNSFNFQQPTTAFRGMFKGVTILLNDNEISEIDPGAFYGVPKVDRINLSRNKFSVLEPGVLDGIKTIHQLFIENNNITSVDPDFFGDTEINLLSLQANNLKSFPMELVKTKKQIKKIWLWANPLPCTFVNENQNHLLYVDQLKKYCKK